MISTCSYACGCDVVCVCAGVFVVVFLFVARGRQDCVPCAQRCWLALGTLPTARMLVHRLCCAAGPVVKVRASLRRHVRCEFARPKEREPTQSHSCAHRARASRGVATYFVSTLIRGLGKDVCARGRQPRGCGIQNKMSEGRREWRVLPSCRADQDWSSLGETCKLEPRIHCDSKRSCSERGATASGERRVKMSSGMSSGPTRHECRVGPTHKHTYIDSLTR